MKVLNIKRISLWLTLILATTGCITLTKTADLRTDFAKAESSEIDPKVLLEEMGVAHGIENWGKVETYTVAFSDEFYGFLGKNSHPFKSEKATFNLSYVTNSYDGKLQFKTGEEAGLQWGIQSWNTYTQLADQAPVFKKDKDIIFWLPTYQYFIEFPLRIQQASALAYAGEQVINGIQCQGIIASWGDTAPQKDIDQYLIWIDNDSKRIVKLEYTVREMYKFLIGAAYYQDYRNYDGILLPQKMPVESNLKKKGLLHEMQILSFAANTMKISDLRPNDSLPVMGDAKLEE